MMEIRALGGFQILVDEHPLSLPNRKSQALLVYLASSSQPCERAVLAELFWPELPEAAALNNLSKTLGQIRKVFEQAGITAMPIEATRHTVHLAGDPSWQLDANLFMQMFEKARAATDTAESTAYLEQAASLYHGEFLAGLSLEDSPTFEGWLLLHRETLMLLARDSYQTVADYYLEHSEFEKARDYGRRQLALDPWHEEAHRQIMRALDGMGLRGDAMEQYESCRKVLRDELGLEPQSATRELYEQIKTGQSGSRLAAPETTLRPSSTRVPKRLLPLVGRERELMILKDDLADPECRIITIVGPGGVGKTSLAMDAAWQAVFNNNTAVTFVPLERLHLSADRNLQDQLATAVGAALELSFSGMEPVNQQLFRLIGSREMLLVLDNFEHLMAEPGGSAARSAALFITSLLEHAPGITVLVTSRERFGIPAEYVLPLEGLPVPEADANVAELANYSSVRLFVEQARRIERTFRLTTENSSSVATICRLVDGLPLGIELAARWTTHFSPEEIASAIQQDLDFLVAASPQAAERHQSIRATFAYSWRMLTDSEKQMLARLSIMQGQFARETALEISEGSLGDLVQLQGKSLLRQEGSGRYSLHQLLRQFAAGKLKEQPASAQDALRRRYAAHYLQMLAEQAKGFDEGWTGEAIKQIAQHIEDIRRAWKIALDIQAFTLLTDSLQPLYHYYRIQGLFHEAQQLFGQTNDTFRALYEQDRENCQVQELLGRVLLRHGRLAWFLADTDLSISRLREGLAHLQQASAHCDLSRAHAYLGEALLRAGHNEEADRLLAKALELYREGDDKNGVATTLELQAVCASQGGYFDEADGLFQESIAISRHSGNRRLEGRGLHDWGLILMQRGKIEQAAERFMESQAIARELNLRMPIAFNRSMLARTDRCAGQYDDARRRLSDSLQVLEGSGYAFYTIRALSMLGEVEAILEEADEAAQSLAEALEQLKSMQMVDSGIFRDLALDFLVATGFFFANSDRKTEAGEALAAVLQYADPESNLGQRARHLADWLSLNVCEMPGEAQVPLREIVNRLRL